MVSALSCQVSSPFSASNSYLLPRSPRHKRFRHAQLRMVVVAGKRLYFVFLLAAFAASVLGRTAAAARAGTARDATEEQA